MDKTVEDLRQHLFETLVALKDKENPMDLARAKAVSDVAQVIINSAKVEVEYAKATGAVGSAFLEMAPIKGPPSEPGTSLPAPGPGVRRYVDGKLVSE
jgi:hypothetical protein